MEFDAEGRPAVRKATDNFSCLCVPQVYQFVETCAQEFATIVGKADVTDGFLVPLVRPDALPVGRRVPDLACAVVAG